MGMERMIVGGGCFWCVEGAYKQIHGVESALPAYAGGHDPHPTYQAVCSGTTGHAEVVEIQFDPSVVSFETLLEVFFTVHDPTQLNRQGNDIGTQYRSCIMPLSDRQRALSEATIADMGEVYDDPIVTTIEEPVNFSSLKKSITTTTHATPTRATAWRLSGRKSQRSEPSTLTSTAEQSLSRSAPFRRSRECMGDVQESPFATLNHGEQHPQATHPRQRTRVGLLARQQRTG